MHIKNKIYYGLLLGSIIFSMIIPYAAARQNFPDEFTDINFVKYDFSQIFTHYVKGTDNAEGTISINIEDLLGDLNFSVTHNLDVWTRSCSDPINFNFEFNYRVNPDNRMINYVDYFSDEFDGSGLKSKHCYYYMETDISVGEYRYIEFDDLLIFRGLPIHEGIVTCVSINDPEDQVYIQGDYYDTIHMQYDVNGGDPTIVYADSICGIGTFVLINATIDLYYEPSSGILLYSKSNFLEYLSANPSIYQEHIIQRVITDLNFPGESGTGFQDSTGTINPFWDDENNRRGVLIIGLIVIATVGSIMLIRQRGLKRKFEILKDMKNSEVIIKDEIKKLKNEISLELKELKEQGIEL